MKRFRVAGHSMLPTLQPGQEVVAVNTRTPAPGNLVVFEEPGARETWLVKRLRDLSGWVTSDNPADASRDSQTLGPVDVGHMWTVVSRLDEGTFSEACDLLTAEDESLARIVDRWDKPEFWYRQPGFATLVWLILEQQVSLESGAAMYRRLADLLGQVRPEAVLDQGEVPLRSIGVTRQKAGYLIDLSLRLVNGDLDLEKVAGLPLPEAQRALVAVKGIGPWTADAYLLSAERRPDMWPVGDRALQVGVGEAVGMSTVPDEGELEVIGEPWRPVRAVAARLIWHAYLSERGRVEPQDPTVTHE